VDFVYQLSFVFDLVYQLSFVFDREQVVSMICLVINQIKQCC